MAVTRRDARQRAVQILYEADLRGQSFADVLDERSKIAEIPPYTNQLIRGIIQHQDRIDELLSTYSQGWSLERMPNVDRQILRVGAFELLWRDDVPDPVCIDEAVEVSRTMSTEKSPKFINGLLGRLQDIKPSIQA